MMDKTEGRVSEELHQTLERLKFHMENSPLAVVEWDTAFLVTRWNDEAERMFGWTREQVLGVRIDALGMVYEEDWPTVEAVMADMISGKRPRNVNKNRNYRKDRSIIHCEWYNSALRDSAGKLVSVLSLILDVTDRKRAEQALRESEERYRRVFESMFSGMALCEMINDASGHAVDFRFLDANPAFETHTGLRAQEVIGKTVREAIPGIDHDWIEMCGRVAQTGEPMHVERFVPALGRHYKVHAYSPVRGQFVALFTDRTERKNAEHLLQRQQQLIRELSTPVLAAEEGLLIVPLIGPMDPQRASQLTEQLLTAIRHHRAKAVVIDVTGVPMIDTVAANHLVLTAQAARLLGSRVVLTGISRDIAHTLVALGVNMRDLHTTGDLRSGIEEARSIRAASQD